MSVGRILRAAVLSVAVLLIAQRALFASPAHSFQLDNGLKVVLKPITSNSKTIDARLIVAFGAQDEEVGEYGWAHLIEHLAFSGTENFSAAQIRSLYQRAHLRLGRDVNAATGDSQTVYQLAVPEGDLDLLHDNLALMADWLSAIDFSENDLRVEKRVIAAEALATEKAGVSPHWQDLLLKNEEPTHLAIGVMNEVEQATSDALKDFWRRGYRPDNATVVLTGDFIPAAVVEKIHQTMAHLHRPSRELSRRKNTSERVELENVVLAHDSKQTQPQVMLARLAEGAEQIRVSSVAMLALQQRVSQLSESSHCGAAQRRVATISSELELHYIERSASLGFEVDCLAEMSSAAVQLHQQPLHEQGTQQLFHLLQSERQRLNTLQQTSDIRRVADQIEVRLINGASAVTAADRLQDLAQWMASSEHQMMADAIALALTPSAFSVVVTTSDALAEDTAALNAIWKHKPSRSKSKSVQSVPSYRPIQPASVSARQQINTSDLQRSLYYDNGAQVHLLQTNNIQDHFDVLLVREGGLLSLPSTLVSAAVKLPVVLPHQAIVGSSAASVHAVLREHKLVLSWFVENFRQGLRASSRGHGAEALFSLLHQSQIPVQTGMIEGREDGLQLASRDSVGDEGLQQLHRVIWRTLYDLGDVAQPPAPSVLDQQSINAARNALYDGGSGLQLYIAGDFEAEQMQSLADQYIGSLPRSNNEYAVPSLRASAKRQRIVHRGNQPDRADLSFYYMQSAANQLERFDAELLLMREVLAQRLWHVVREREGLSYDVGLQLQRRAYQRGGSSFKVSLVCAPSLAGDARRRVDEVLLSLIEDGVAEEELLPLQNRLASDYRALLTDNASLLDEWSSQRDRGRTLLQVHRTVAEIESVDSKRLQQFARQFFRDTGFLEVALMPGFQANRGLSQPSAFVKPQP